MEGDNNVILGLPVEPISFVHFAFIGSRWVDYHRNSMHGWTENISGAHKAYHIDQIEQTRQTVADELKTVSYLYSYSCLLHF